MNRDMATYSGGKLSDIEDMTGWSGMALTKIFRGDDGGTVRNVEPSMIWVMLDLARPVNALPGRAGALSCSTRKRSMWDDFSR